MNGRACDIAIVGGGLAGGLTALTLARTRPDLDVMLIESGATLGGNHRWSWFASDLDADSAELLAAFPAERWEAGYDVAFEGFERRLRTGYRSLGSHAFAATLQRALPAGSVLTGIGVSSLDAAGVVLADGARIAARAVIDARGPAPADTLEGGWQVFLGRHLRLAAPHGLARPTIMDAGVEQIGGFRFVYVLPLSADDVFVEDTYYQDEPRLDSKALRRRVDAYCAARGWRGEVVNEETGCLPVITGGDFTAFQQAGAVPGVTRIGARGGFFHPLTSYSLPFAAETARWVAANADLPGAAMAERVAQRARDHWRATRFYRQLGAMLFAAAEPAERWRVFARFYTLENGLIERFYAGRSTLADRVRILCGRPPVPIGRALRALARPQPSLRYAA